MNLCDVFDTLNIAIDNSNSSEVARLCVKILHHREVDTHPSSSTWYADALIAAIKKGNPDIFERVCSIPVKHLTFFTPQKSREIAEQLDANDDVRLRSIFLPFLSKCQNEPKASLMLAVYMQQSQPIIDQICNDPPHADLRYLLAQVAITFNNLDLVWRVVQTTPKALPPLKNCNPTTEEGLKWIEIHERYNVWRAQEEHAVLTAEVQGMDSHLGKRKM